METKFLQAGAHVLCMWSEDVDKFRAWYYRADEVNIFAVELLLQGACVRFFVFQPLFVFVFFKPFPLLVRVL